MRKDTMIRYESFVLFPERFELYYKGVPKEITPVEYALFMELIDNKGFPLTREHLFKKVLGYAYDGDSRAIDVHIRRLRSKIDPEQKYIITVKRKGYKAIDRNHHPDSNIFQTQAARQAANHIIETFLNGGSNGKYYALEDGITEVIERFMGVK